ncbi:hypothetical protein [Georgenia alba]|uniref:Sensory transduction regulator n=1 Tax=Georgenia alba TaxID=2233858 RepID=A0ABW2Q4Z4_9MICO
MSTPSPGNLTAALEKLPPLESTAFRVSPEGAEFVRDGQMVVTAGPLSATRDPALLGAAPVLYAIAGRTGRDISPFSANRTEQETVFLPGTVFALWSTIDVDGRAVRLVFETEIGQTIDGETVEAFTASVRAAVTSLDPAAVPPDRFIGDIA